MELTGSREYGVEGLYFVRPVVPAVRAQWSAPPVAREIVELWPAMGFPGWSPVLGEPALPAADPL